MGQCLELGRSEREFLKKGGAAKRRAKRKTHKKTQIKEGKKNRAFVVKGDRTSTRGGQKKGGNR